MGGDVTMVMEEAKRSMHVVLCVMISPRPGAAGGHFLP